MSYQSGIPKFFNIAVSSKAWFPTPSANLAGTVSGNGKEITGIGTAFRTDISPGDYMLNTQDEVAIVHRVHTDTTLTLEAAFPSGMATSTYQRIKAGGIKYVNILFNGTGVGNIRGVDQTAVSNGGTWPAGIICPLWQDGGLRPFLVTTPSTATAHVTTIE